MCDGRRRCGPTRVERLSGRERGCGEREPEPLDTQTSAAAFSPPGVSGELEGVAGKGAGDHPEILEKLGSNLVYVSMFLMVLGGI